MVERIEDLSWWKVLLLAPNIGIFWGIMTGGAGGAIVFLIGALIGGLFGAMVGGAAMPLFLILHRWLKKGEYIELRYFLPIAFGIALTISSFILGIGN